LLLLINNSYSKKLHILFGALIAGMCLIFPVFVIAVVADVLISHVWTIVFVASSYMLAVLISSTIAAVLSRIHFGFPIAAGALAYPGMSLVFVMMILF